MIKIALRNSSSNDTDTNSNYSLERVSMGFHGVV